MKFKIAIFYLLPALLLSTGSAQGPWIQPDGRFYGQIAVNFIPAYQQLYRTAGATSATEREIEDMTVQAWLEYGLFRYSTILLDIPYKILKAGDLVGDMSGTAATQSSNLKALGNIRMGWKQQVNNSTLVSAAWLWLELPTASYQEKTGLRSGYDALAVIPAFSIGTSSDRWYTFGHLALGIRSNNYSDYTRLGFETGYELFSDFNLAGFVEWVISLQNGSRIDPSNNYLTGLYVNDQEFVSWGFKVFSELIDRKFGVSAALAGAFSGNYVPKAPSLNIGLYYQH